MDTVFAEHVNSLQDEVSALETTVGTSVKTSSGWIGSFDQVTSTWSSLKDRINNIEYGLYVAYNTNTSTNGGSTIQSTANGTTSLTIKAKSGQTANLLELQLSDGTVVSKVNASGEIYTSNKRVVPIVYSSTLPTSVPAGTVWVDSTSDVATLNVQSGVPSGGLAGQVLSKNSDTSYDTTWVSIDLITPHFLLGGM